MKKLKLGRHRLGDSSSQPKPPRAPKAARSLTLTPLSSPWRLTVRAWRDFIAHWRPYIAVVAIVVVPVNILSLMPSVMADGSFNAYSTVASAFMGLALVYTLAHVAEGKGVPRLKAAYYDSSLAAVRFLLTGALVLVLLLPLAIGVAVYLLGTSAGPGTTITGGESLLIGLVALLPASVSLWWVIRFGLSFYAVIQDGLAPIAALKRSRLLTLGRFWRVAGQVAFMVVGFLVFVFAAYIVTAVVGIFVHQAAVLNAVYLVLLALPGLPLANLYLLKLYRELARDYPLV